MNEKLKIILDNAIKEEQYFHEFYKALAEKANEPAVKKELLKLSEQELIHKEKLRSLNFERIGDKIIADAIDEFDIEEEIALNPIEEFRNIKEMLEFAIKQEVLAKVTYLKMAKTINDDEAMNIFEMLAEEEKKHELLLTGKLALLEQQGAVDW